jgi:hypothetical protein
VGSEEGGGCDAVSERGGDAGAVRAHASRGAGGCTVGFSRRKKLGGAHTVVRGEGGGGWAGRRPRPGGEGGRWLGMGRRRRPKRGGGEWAGGRSRGPGGKRKEARLKSLLGLKSKEVKEKSI